MTQETVCILLSYKLCGLSGSVNNRTAELTFERKPIGEIHERRTVNLTLAGEIGVATFHRAIHRTTNNRGHLTRRLIAGATTDSGD